MASPVSNLRNTNPPPQVIWRVTNWPPFYILEGPQRGQGLYDRMIQVYQDALPEFQHSNVEMTTMRALQQMKNRQEDTVICHVSMSLQSLSGFALNSKLTSILPAHVIIAHKDVANDIRALSDKGDGYVSIEKLILDHRFKGAHSSFGTHKELKKYNFIDDPVPNAIITSENYTSLGKLFVNGRVDYIVQYEPFIEALISQGISPEEIAIIPIEETRDRPFVRVYAGCTYNALGQVVIDTINRLSIDKLQELQNTRLHWLAPNGTVVAKSLFEKINPHVNAHLIEGMKR